MKVLEVNMIPKGGLPNLKREANAKHGEVISVKNIKGGWIEVKILYTVEE